MPGRRRVTVKEVRELEAELAGAHVLLAAILNGVGGRLVLSRQELEALAVTSPRIKAYDIQGADAFILEIERNEHDSDGTAGDGSTGSD